jgi:hypothetical protein
MVTPAAKARRKPATDFQGRALVCDPAGRSSTLAQKQRATVPAVSTDWRVGRQPAKRLSGCAADARPRQQPAICSAAAL